MIQKRRRRGEVREQIIENLKEEGSLSFTRLRNEIAEASGKPVADKVVWHNLEILREEGKLEKGKKGKWRITESYWAPLAKRELIGALTREGQRVKIGHPAYAPTFSLGGGGRHIQASGAELDDIAVKTLTKQISEMFERYSTNERKIILDFASRSLWNGYWSYRNENDIQELHIRFREKKYGRDLKIEDLIDLWKVEILFSMDVEPYDEFGFWMWNGAKEVLEGGSLNLPEHVMRLLFMSLARFLYEGVGSLWYPLVQGLNRLERAYRTHSTRGEIEEKLVELKRVTFSQKIPLEEPANIGREVKFDLKEVPTDHKKNLDWLREHKDSFLKFVGDVRDIRFAQVVAVGYKELEHYPWAPNVIKDTEDWVGSLKDEWDPLAAIDLKIFLHKALPNTIYRLEKGKKPRKRFKLPGLYSSLRDVYEYYPRAKKLEWWKKIKTKVEEKVKMESPI